MEKRLVQLDGLRAIAIIGVLISHFPPTHGLEWTKGLPFGVLGVRLFFVLSGFLITGILLDQKRSLLGGQQTSRNELLSSFYARRFLRIFPIYYLTIAVAYFLDVGHIRDVVGWHLAYLSNFEPAIFDGFPSEPKLRDPTTGHFWSLAVEEQFYLIWPALAMFVPNEKLKKILIFTIAAALVWRVTWILFVPKMASMALLGCVDTLGAGALLALAIHERQANLHGLLRRCAIWGAAIVALCCTAFEFGAFWRPSIVLIDTGAALLFPYVIWRASKNTQDVLGKLLQQGWLVYIGRISYGIYIYHAFMTPLKEWGLSQFSLAQIVPGSLEIPFVTTMMTVVVASLSWYLVEVPLGRLKRFFPRYGIAGGSLPVGEAIH